MKADNRTFNLDCWPLIGTASPTASTSRYASVKMPVISKGAPSLGRYVTASPITSITGAITASSQSIDISDHRRGQRRVHAAWNHNRRGLHHQMLDIVFIDKPIVVQPQVVLPPAALVHCAARNLRARVSRIAR